MRGVAWITIGIIGLLFSGSLGAPYQRDEVGFSTVRRSFDAIGVIHDEGAPAQSPLRVRIQLLGDGKDADISQASAWLLEHANVVVDVGPNGAPLYLTQLDLSATSGRATLGATLNTGMSAEVGDPRVAPCVIAHEILHFLGLKHVNAESNIMHPQCARDKLASSQLSPAQRATIDRLHDIVATTPRGVETWASRE